MEYKSYLSSLWVGEIYEKMLLPWENKLELIYHKWDDVDVAIVYVQENRTIQSDFNDVIDFIQPLDMEVSMKLTFMKNVASLGEEIILSHHKFSVVDLSNG